MAKVLQGIECKIHMKVSSMYCEQKTNVKSGVAATGDSRMSVLPPEGISPGSLPLLYRFSLRIGVLFRGTLVLLPLPIIGPERLTIVVDALT